MAERCCCAEGWVEILVAAPLAPRQMVVEVADEEVWWIQ